MLKVIIKDGEDKEGSILYDEATEKLSIAHPNRDVRNSVRGYLKEPREFTDSPSEQVGSRHLIVIEPIKTIGFMYKALVEMQHEIGVTVVWGDPDNVLPDSQNPYLQDGIPGTGDPNALITKSLDGSTFMIINKDGES